MQVVCFTISPSLQEVSFDTHIPRYAYWWEKPSFCRWSRTRKDQESVKDSSLVELEARARFYPHCTYHPCPSSVKANPLPWPGYTIDWPIVHSSPCSSSTCFYLFCNSRGYGYNYTPRNLPPNEYLAMKERLKVKLYRYQRYRWSMQIKRLFSELKEKKVERDVQSSFLPFYSDLVTPFLHSSGRSMMYYGIGTQRLVSHMLRSQGLSTKEKLLR